MKHVEDRIAELAARDDPLLPDVLDPTVVSLLMAVIANARYRAERPHPLGGDGPACWGMRPHPRDQGLHDASLAVYRCGLCATLRLLDAETS